MTILSLIGGLPLVPFFTCRMTTNISSSSEHGVFSTLFLAEHDVFCLFPRFSHTALAAFGITALRARHYLASLLCPLLLLSTPKGRFKDPAPVFSVLQLSADGPIHHLRETVARVHDHT